MIPAAIICLCVLIIYNPLWLDPFTMKWDLAEQYLPWRHFISRNISQEVVPFWNPFQLGGYPSYLDPQSAFWYYPVWIISLFCTYNMQVIELEIVISICIASVGFYRLALYHGVSSKAALITAIGYGSSGFMIGNAQHMTWILGATYIPWVILYYFKSKLNEDLQPKLVFAIFFYLLVTSAYPAFTITLAYLLALDAIYSLIKNKSKIQILSRLVIVITASLLLLIPLIYAFMNEHESFSRGVAIPWTKAIQHPFSWMALSSMLLPFASFKNPELFHTDISMSNAYIGLIPLLFSFWALTMKKDKKEWVMMVWSLFFLLLSFGEATPLRKLLYDFVPGFSLFRFPSLFRLFFIGFALMFSGFAIDKFVKNSTKEISNLLKLSFVLVLIFVTLIVLKFEHATYFHIENLSILAQQIEVSSFAAHLWFQSIIQLTFCLFLLFIIYKRRSINWIIVIALVDMFVAVRLNTMGTMTYSTKTRQVDQLIAHAKGAYSAPPIEKLKDAQDETYLYRWPLNWNLNNYFGKIAPDGYNPFVLNSYNRLSENKQFDSLINLPWTYLQNNSIDKSAETHKLKIQGFTTQKVNFTIDNPNEGSLVIAQNPHPYWIAYDEHQHEIPISIVHTSQISIQLNKEKNANVFLEFRPTTLKRLLFLQWLVLGLYLLYLCIIPLKKIIKFADKS